MIPALSSCASLQILDLSGNPSITTGGWQSFATILEAPNSNLQKIYVEQNNIDDDAVDAFANALTNNHTLQVLGLDSNPIADVGWQALSKLLCRSSSVNATFLSNHTLRNVGLNNAGANEIIGTLLRLNERRDKKEVAIIKILLCHDDFDMLPFFEWEFKVLPLVLSWFERASVLEMPDNFEPNIERRKLSTIYQFVRGMPVLYVETRLRKELEDLKEEQRMLEQRNNEIEERRMDIMRRLGRQ